MSFQTVYLMTGDIGGTNSRMSLYASGTSVKASEPLVVKYFRNQEALPPSCYSDPAAFMKNVIQPFLTHCWESEEGAKGKLVPIEQASIVACLATAGVVGDNKVRMTNLGNLLIDGTAVEKETSNKYTKAVVRCQLINDFVAQGYGCLTLEPSEVKHLNGPKVAPQELTVGPKVCVGAGTGLGECYLTQPVDKGQYTCFPSEGGHVEFAPRNALEVDMFNYLSKKLSSKDRISVERVVSGRGLANVYEFLAQKFPDKVDKAVHKEFEAAGDQQGRVVGVNASKEGSLCRQAMAIMMSAYGCECGSAAVKWIPTGGLFVTGGLTPKNMKFIEGEKSDFMLSFLNKGRVSPVLDRVPLYAVLVEDLGVRGAHKAAQMAHDQYEQQGAPAAAKSSFSLSSSSSSWPSWTTVAAAAAVGFAIGCGVMAARMRK